MSRSRRAVIVTGADRRGALALAASVAVAAASDGRRVLLAELGVEPKRRATTLLASPQARDLERGLREAGAPAAARGHICHLGVAAAAGGTERLALLAGQAGAEVLIAHLRIELWLEALGCALLRPRGGLLLAQMPADRSLAALFSSELRVRGVRARVESRAPGLLAGRRALAGIRAAGPPSRHEARLAAALVEGVGAR